MLKKINKTYHLLVYTQLTTNASNWNSLLCFFDWGLLPRSRWKVKMYMCSGTIGFSSNQAIQVFSDFGQNNNELVRNIDMSLPLGNKDYKHYLGTVINFTNRSANATFWSNADDNGETFLDCTPTNNLFNMYLYNHGSNQGLFTPNTNSNMAIFGFSFEQLDDPIYRTIKSSYNIVFNSEYAGLNSTTNNDLGNLNYFFDWKQLKQGQYNVTCSLLTSDDSSSSINFGSYAIFCDLGQGNNSVFGAMSSSGGKLKDVNFLSLARIVKPVSKLPLISFNDSTPPIFLNSRPTNNNITIFILSSYSTQIFFTRPLGTIVNYTLCLNFQWLGENFTE